MTTSKGLNNTLRRRIQDLETELEHLKSQLLEAEAVEAAEVVNIPTIPKDQWTWPLDPNEYRRYGRQMIMPEVALQGRPL